MPAAPNAFWGGLEAGKGCTATFPERSPCGLQAAGKELGFPCILARALLRTDGSTLWVVRPLYAACGIEGVIRQLGVVPLRRDVFWGGGIGAVWIV